MSGYIHPRTAAMLGLAEGLELLAREILLRARQYQEANRPVTPRGSTLRPGPETPLWNALVSIVQPHLQERGAKAVLARELDLHPARMGEFFDRQSAMPDAERALRLLIWASSRTPRKRAATAPRESS